MPQGKLAVGIVVVLLVFAPLLGEGLAHRQAAHPLALAESAGDFRECSPTKLCVADFDGDGLYGSIEVVRLHGAFYPNNRALLVMENKKELLWAPFYHAEGAPPTRLAVRMERGRARLLVYDGMTGLGFAVFELEDDRLVWAKLDEGDRAVFNVMSAYDTDRILSSREGEEHDAYKSFIIIKLFVYYMTLCVIAAVALYRKSVRMSAAGGNP